MSSSAKSFIAGLSKVQRRLLVAIGIVAVLLIFSSLRSGSDEKKAPSREGNSFTAAELAQLFSQGRATLYEGQTVTVRGIVDSQGLLVGVHPYVALEVVKDGKLDAMVMCFLDETKPQFVQLTKGREVQYTGILQGVVGSVVTMEKCFAVEISGLKIGPAVQTTSSPDESRISPPAEPRKRPTDKAIENSIAALRMQIGSDFVILDSAAEFVDHEVRNDVNVNYAITTFLSIRWHVPGLSPSGYVKRTASFACMADGTVMNILEIPNPYPVP